MIAETTQEIHMLQDEYERASAEVEECEQLIAELQEEREKRYLERARVEIMLDDLSKATSTRLTPLTTLPPAF